MAWTFYNFVVQHGIRLSVYEFNLPFRSTYTFPDKDVCCACSKIFPHQQLNLFTPTSYIHSTNLTCTLAWIVQDSDEFNNRIMDLFEISQPFNFLSIGLQFFVFLRFDKNFSDILRNLWQRLIY